MGNYDLSSQRAIAAAAAEVEKERLRLHEVGFQTGKYAWQETNYLSAYGQALKDCAEQLEPMQRVFDSMLGYLKEHCNSNELYQILCENAGISYEDVGFAKLNLSDILEMSGEVEFVRDFSNGYKIQKVFANQLPDGSYGDIYDLCSDAMREHPGDKVMIGYCVVDTVDGMVPMGCNDWNNTVAEAIADYKENVEPYLDVRDIEVHSWKEMQEKYPMDRDKMTEEEEMAFVEDCYKLYEQEGFSPRYWSPFTDNAERIGLPIEIVGRIEEDNSHDLNCLPMWKARLDGCEFEVFPEEVIPSEMKANGCRWFEDILEYDRGLAERVAGLPVDVMNPQEMADSLGKAVRDDNKYYLPIEKTLLVKIEDAQERASDSRSDRKEEKEKEGLF